MAHNGVRRLREAATDPAPIGHWGNIPACCGRSWPKSPGTRSSSRTGDKALSCAPLSCSTNSSTIPPRLGRRPTKFACPASLDPSGARSLRWAYQASGSTGRSIPGEAPLFSTFYLTTEFGSDPGDLKSCRCHAATPLTVVESTATSHEPRGCRERTLERPVQLPLPKPRCTSNATGLSVAIPPP
jgi:hypothetical protein